MLELDINDSPIKKWRDTLNTVGQEIEKDVCYKHIENRENNKECHTDPFLMFRAMLPNGEFTFLKEYKSLDILLPLMYHVLDETEYSTEEDDYTWTLKIKKEA